jgi:2-hydroxychromene-2-carboxylate isomerase
MNQPLIDYHFDFSCPYAYLGSLRIEALAAAHGSTLRWRPFLLGGVFRSLGYEADTVAAKARHNLADMHRWADHFGATLRMPAAHPMRTVRALRTLIALDERHWSLFIAAVYRRYWVEGADITTSAAMDEVLAELPLDSAERQRAAGANDDPSIKADLHRRTDEALALGVFGAPTTVVRIGDDSFTFWGQDRLELVAEVLAGWRPGVNRQPSPPSKGSPSDRILEFWYDFSSPFAYLGSTQVEALAERTGARLVWRPMLLGGLFKSIGQVIAPILSMSSAKQAYVNKELGYWSSYWGVPFRWNRRFPVNTVTAARLALLAGDQDVGGRWRRK